jgi:hypothetical protein
VVCVASKQDPSDRLGGDRLGVFARAILRSVAVRSGARDFNPSLDLYSPLNVNERVTLIFDRQPRPVENLAAELRSSPARPR